jgi:hypothetical protein
MFLIHSEWGQNRTGAGSEISVKIIFRFSTFFKTCGLVKGPVSGYGDFCFFEFLITGAVVEFPLFFL